MESTDSILYDLFSRYQKSGAAIEVDFRELVHWIPYGERATHFIHPYPAKLLAHIPHFFLANNIFSKPGDTVLDPFCGSGTVMLEALLAGRSAIGCDANPLAVLISNVKTTRLDMDDVKHEIDSLQKNIPEKPHSKLPDVVNRKYWFYPHVQKKLQRIFEALETTTSSDIRNFFKVCFSYCVRKVSLADPRMSVPVRLNPARYKPGHRLKEKAEKRLKQLKRVDVISEFFEIVDANYKRMERFNGFSYNGNRTKALRFDCRESYGPLIGAFSSNGVRLDNHVDIVITSPPYIGAQKYIRACSLSIGWLGMCASDNLINLERSTIGREHFRKSEYRDLITTGIDKADVILKDIHSLNPLRSQIAAAYLVEMRQALHEIHHVLKPGGYLILVAGDNQVCGEPFETHEYLNSIAEEIGFFLELKLVDRIHSRGLMTRRNRTSGVIAREWILVLKKENHPWKN